MSFQPEQYPLLDGRREKDHRCLDSELGQYVPSQTVGWGKLSHLQRDPGPMTTAALRPILEGRGNLTPDAVVLLASQR